jgi:hypothetical protein
MKDSVYNSDMILEEKYKSHIWYRYHYGIRNSNILYKMNDFEIYEFKKSVNIYYFISKWFPDIKLEKYQKDVIDNYYNYRNNTIVSFQQSDLSKIFALIFLHTIIYNNEKNILTNDKIINKYFIEFYIRLPFFLKPGVKKFTQKQIYFENGSLIDFYVTKEFHIGREIHILYLNDVDYISFTEMINNLLPSISSIKDSKMIFLSDFKHKESEYHKFIKDCEIDLYNFNVNYIKWSDVMEISLENRNMLIKCFGNDGYNCKCLHFKKDILLDRKLKILDIRKNLS